ncbi:MAG TPA: SDR family NAD(P)-dependent oxidoreductase, partial [Dongiaceae bacterium]|nr:SDR family NAD(P)-dependent oxidoreductase [Dongiaceae bacterium]
MQLNNRTILVTGGTSGIGEALIQRLASINQEIIVIGRNAVKLENLQDRYNNLTPYRCSLDSRGEVETTLHKIMTHHPALSVIINNAGVQFTPRFLDPDFSFESIESEITTNLTAPAWICALTLRHLLKTPSAAIINISSGLALFPKTSSAIYCATKAGLHNFSRSLRYQLEGTHINVHEAIMPLVETPMTAGRGKGKITADAAAAAIIAGVEKGKPEIYVGKARLMPVIARLSP